VTALPTTEGKPTVVPTLFNGYVSVAQLAVLVPAGEVRRGDIVINGNCVVEVHEDARTLGPLPGHGGLAVFIAGTMNLLRFPHEHLFVVRGQ
jgi:hypothetical protein